MNSDAIRARSSMGAASVLTLTCLSKIRIRNIAVSNCKVLSSIMSASFMLRNLSRTLARRLCRRMRFRISVRPCRCARASAPSSSTPSVMFSTSVSSAPARSNKLHAFSRRLCSVKTSSLRSRICTASSTALYKGEWPLPSRTLGFARCLSNSCTTPTSPRAAARCTGVVSWLPARSSTSKPSAMSRAHMRTSPVAAAACKIDSTSADPSIRAPAVAVCKYSKLPGPPGTMAGSMSHNSLNTRSSRF
mmetsp:Transcript_22537/g.56305  ORF Transcript_22537/g.56305 Transcript_22537/m.56305 type:complete len:247 (+) Transcript_22537:1612-2352(+)